MNREELDTQIDDETEEEKQARIEKGQARSRGEVLSLITGHLLREDPKSSPSLDGLNLEGCDLSLITFQRRTSFNGTSLGRAILRNAVMFDPLLRGSIDFTSADTGGLILIFTTLKFMNEQGLPQGLNLSSMKKMNVTCVILETL